MTFSKAERYGIAGLFVLMMLLLVIRFSMQYWVEPPGADVQEVVVAAEKIKKEETQSLNKQAEKKELIPGTKINLNTADSLTLISLPGIGKGLSHRILERRRQLGNFTNMEQVLEVYKFKAETKEMLLQHTVVE